MLEQREFDFILTLTQSKMLRLERAGLPMRMTDSWELFLQLPFIRALTPSQQRRLKALMEAQAVRRSTYDAHHVLFDRRQRAPGLIVPVRGSLRLLYEQQTADEEETMEDELRALMRAANADLAAPPPPPFPIRSATREARHRRFHVHETVGRGGVLGAYEMLTQSSTLAVCSSVTLAEAFVLDRDCVALLCEEDDSCGLLCKAAAEALLKAHWRRWAVAQHTKLSEHQLHHLVERATAVRTPDSTPEAGAHSLDLRASDVLLLVRGTARGRGMKRRVPQSRPSTAAPPPPSAAVPLSASGPSPPRPSPVYEGPCWLRRRRGRLELQPSALYLTWTLRDEDIASLFPPPSRADMASYARQLGLTMRLAQQHMQTQQPPTAHHHDTGQQPTARPHSRKEESAAAASTAAAGGRSETPPPPSSSPVLPSLGSVPSPSSTHPLLSRSLAPSLSTYMGGTLRRRSVDDGRLPRSGPAVAASASAASGRSQAEEEAGAGEQKWSGAVEAPRRSTAASAGASLAATTAPHLLRRRSEVGEQSSDDTAESERESEWEDDDWAAADASLALHRGRAAEGEGGSGQGAGATAADEEAIGSKAADAVLAGEIEACNARTV